MQFKHFYRNRNRLDFNSKKNCFNEFDCWIYLRTSMLLIYRSFVTISFIFLEFLRKKELNVFKFILNHLQFSNFRQKKFKNE